MGPGEPPFLIIFGRFAPLSRDFDVLAEAATKQNPQKDEKAYL